MFTAKEAKNITQTFPHGGRDIPNPYNVDCLIPSRSKDGFVQSRVVQEALRRAIEDDDDRLSISSFASLYDLDVDVVTELLRNSFEDLVWSRSRDAVLSRSEGHRLKEKLIQGSEEQFLDVEKFLLEHDVQRSLLAAIDKPIILESIDQDGKCYLHSMQLTEKVRTHIKGRLSLAENDASVTNLMPSDLPGHPPTAFIYRVVKELSDGACGPCKARQEVIGSGIVFTPGSHRQKELEAQLTEVGVGDRLYLDASSFIREAWNVKRVVERKLFKRGLGSNTISIIFQKFVSEKLFQKVVQDLRKQMLATGYAQMPATEAGQDIDEKLQKAIVSDLARVYKGRSFSYKNPFVISDYWLDCRKQELAKHIDSRLQARWDMAPPLEALADPPTAEEMGWNCPSLVSLPSSLSTLLLSSESKAMNDWHNSKLESLHKDVLYTFSAFWLKRVSTAIEAYIMALLKIKDAKLRDNSCVALAIFIQMGMVPKASAKAYTRRLIRKISLANELEKLQSDLGKISPPDSSSFSSSSSRTKGRVFPSSGNASYDFLESILYRIWQFTELHSIPFLSSSSVYQLRCRAQLQPGNLHPSLSQAELPFQSVIPLAYIVERRDFVFEELRCSMVDETDDAKLYLLMLIVLFACRHQVVVYATGKAAPKLLKELLEPGERSLDTSVDAVTAGPAESNTSNSIEQEKQDKGTESSIPFNSEQASLFARRGIHAEVDFGFGSSRFLGVRARLVELKEKVKQNTVTPADRVWMKAISGVVEYPSGKVLLKGHRDRKGKWVRNKSDRHGRDRDEEEFGQVKAWLRMTLEGDTPHEADPMTPLDQSKADGHANNFNYEADAVSTDPQNLIKESRIYSEVIKGLDPYEVT